MIKWVICPESGVSIAEVRDKKGSVVPSGSTEPFLSRAITGDIRRAGLKGGNPLGKGPEGIPLFKPVADKQCPNRSPLLGGWAQVARRDLQARWPPEPITPSGGFSARADKAGWWWGFEGGLSAGAKPRALSLGLCYTFTGLADITRYPITEQDTFLTIFNFRFHTLWP